MFDLIFVNTSQILGILCVLGLIGVGFRWRHAVRRDFLFAYVLVLVGLFLRELAVYLYGSSNWPQEAVILSFTSRWVTISGAILFVRASSLHVCGEKGWIFAILFSLLVASVW